MGGDRFDLIFDSLMVQSNWHECFERVARMGGGSVLEGCIGSSLRWPFLRASPLLVCLLACIRCDIPL